MKSGYVYYIWVLLLVVVLVIFPCCVKPQGNQPVVEQPKKITEYYIAGMADYTGPFASVVKQWTAGADASLNWWNENVGKDIGVKLTIKWYDFRYDMATATALWPEMLSSINPIFVFGWGGPDNLAYTESTKEDKVPLISMPSTYGFAWKPDTWLFQYAPTAVHEMSAALDYLIESTPESERPVKVCMVGVENNPIWIEGEKGGAWMAENVPYYKENMEWMGVAWIPRVPVDITDVLRPFVDKDADVYDVMGPVLYGVAVHRALDGLGVHKPIIVTVGDNLLSLSQTLGWENMEGYIEPTFAASPLEKDIPAYTELWTKYHPAGTDIEEDWTMITPRTVAQGLIIGRAAEIAAATVGPENITGQAMYDAMFKVEMTKDNSLGLLKSGAKWSKDRPFPIDGYYGAAIDTVKDGKYIEAVPWMEVRSFDWRPALSQ
jgi:branched-chain amino acid transport system substrate-binding protein